MLPLLQLLPTVIAAITAIFGFLLSERTSGVSPVFFLCKIREVQAKNSNCKFWGKFHKWQIMPFLCNGLNKWISKKKLEMLFQLVALFSKTRLKFCNNVLKKN